MVCSFCFNLARPANLSPLVRAVDFLTIRPRTAPLGVALRGGIRVALSNTKAVALFAEGKDFECNGDFAPTMNERKQAGLEMMYELAG